jgi:hypothetical protein
MIRLIVSVAIAPLLLAASEPVSVEADSACMIGRLSQDDQRAIGRSLSPGAKKNKADEKRMTDMITGALLACSGYPGWNEKRMEQASSQVATMLMMNVAAEDLLTDKIDVADIQTWFDNQSDKTQQNLFGDQMSDAENNAAVVSLTGFLADRGVSEALTIERFEKIAVVLASMTLRARLKAGLPI